MGWARRLGWAAAVVALSGCTMVGSSRPVGPAPEVEAERGADRSTRGAPGTSRPNLAPELPRTSSAPGIEPGSEEEPGFDPSEIPDAVPPESEPLSRYGNAAEYMVFGRTYSVLESSEGYDEVGEASWYGEQFHGRPTSSQEPFDMYAMTAAHKSLPVPSYVEVENLGNGRKAVVRVNDRGPFHEGRIIDLSYAAALKLGVVGPGVARVRVRAVGPVQTRR